MSDFLSCILDILCIMRDARLCLKLTFESTSCDTMMVSKAMMRECKRPSHYRQVGVKPKYSSDDRGQGKHLLTVGWGYG